jgi:hypothetical protein
LSCVVLASSPHFPDRILHLLLSVAHLHHKAHNGSTNYRQSCTYTWQYKVGRPCYFHIQLRSSLFLSFFLLENLALTIP